jgi:hypothetical protein
MTQGNTLGLPTREELIGVVRAWQPDPAKWIGSSILPMRSIGAQSLLYDEEQVTGGMTALHTMDSDPTLIKGDGWRRFQAEPYFFKEGFRLNESDLLTIRAQSGAPFVQGVGNDAPRAGRSLVLSRLAKLDRRLETRLEWMRWQTLMGSLVLNQNGVVASETWPVQTYAATDNGGVAWSTVATADPVKDFNNVALLYDYKGATYDGARAYMNLTTSRYLLQNTNLRNMYKNDLHQRQLVSVAQITDLFTTFTGMTPVIYNEGYRDDAGAFQKFIPDGKVIVVGNPTIGDEMGFVMSVPSLHNGGIDNPQPGKFVIVDDQTGAGEPNPFYDAYEGQYCGPVLLHPEYIVLMTVA